MHKIAPKAKFNFRFYGFLSASYWRQVKQRLFKRRLIFWRRFLLPWFNFKRFVEWRHCVMSRRFFLSLSFTFEFFPFLLERLKESKIDANYVEERHWRHLSLSFSLTHTRALTWRCTHALTLAVSLFTTTLHICDPSNWWLPNIAPTVRSMFSTYPFHNRSIGSDNKWVWHHLDKLDSLIKMFTD